MFFGSGFDGAFSQIAPRLLRKLSDSVLTQSTPRTRSNSPAFTTPLSSLSTSSTHSAPHSTPAPRGRAQLFSPERSFASDTSSSSLNLSARSFTRNASLSSLNGSSHLGSLSHSFLSPEAPDLGELESEAMQSHQWWQAPSLHHDTHARSSPQLQLGRAASSVSTPTHASLSLSTHTPYTPYTPHTPHAAPSASTVALANAAAAVGAFHSPYSTVPSAAYAPASFSALPYPSTTAPHLPISPLVARVPPPIAVPALSLAHLHATPSPTPGPSSGLSAAGLGPGAVSGIASGRRRCSINTAAVPQTCR